MIEFSIIIPVYNAEGTLKRCLQAIERQDYPYWEAILVDDGSKDKGADICRYYSEKDSRFVFLQQENAGPSSARNTGLKIARGHYIAFADSDDEILPGYFSTLLRTFEASDSEVVFFGCERVDTATGETDAILPHLTTETMPEQAAQLHRQDLFGYTWIKAFCRESIGQVCFPTDMTLMEDLVFTCQVIKSCRKIAAVPELLYRHYVSEPTALTNIFHPDYCELQDKSFLELRELLGENYCELSYVAEQMLNACKYYYFEHDMESKTYLRQLEKSSFLEYIKEEDTFLKCLRFGRYRMLALLRRKYRLKQRIRAIIKGI